MPGYPPADPPNGGILRLEPRNGAPLFRGPPHLPEALQAPAHHDLRRAREPRLHDLRHTFACRCLLRWYADGKDLDHAVAALSTYLGHVKVSDTYWYLTGIPELLDLAAGRFERFTSLDPGDLA